MVKSRKILALVFATMLVLAISLSVLAGCGGAKAGEYNVTFMVKENGTGEWREVYSAKSNSDGVVSMPSDPVIPGYSFRDWYVDEACQNRFDGTNVTSNMKVYAFMSDKIVTVNIKNAAGENVKVENQTVATLNALEETEIANAKASNLTFDGFYTNEGYTTKFDINSEATVLYARYAAKVEFYNGYEVLKSQLINPGSKVTAPKVDTLKKDYMDAEGISYVSNADRVTPFNFNDAISVNTVVRINWRTPFLEFKVVEGTKMAYVKDITWSKENDSLINSFQVISIPNEVVIDEVKYDVVASVVSPASSQSVKKFIFQEGIEHIANLSTSLIESKLEEVELPTTLKYLEGSFNNLNQIKSIELPDGVIGIYNSFWKGYNEGVVNAVRAGGYDFEIKIPASVKNIVSVPNNLTYAEGSTFYNEGNYVYNNDPEFGKTIVAMIQSAVDGVTLTIPNGIDALQVGVFDGINFEYLNLPASFTKVAYNLEKSEHPTFVGSFPRLSIRSAVNTPDANPTKSEMSYQGFSIISNVDDYKFIAFDSAEYPANMNKYAFIDWAKAPGESISQITPFDQLEKTTVVFVGKKAEGEAISITVKATNTMVDSVKEKTISGIVSGGELTKDVLLDKAGITEAALGYKFKVDSIKQFGKDFEFGVVDRNLYIDIDYAFSATGFTYEEDANGDLIVTGFDKETAQNLETNPDPEFSTYLMAIPNEFNGKKVVAIKDGAFENNKLIAKVYIGSNVKVIGKKAFKNAKNLESVVISEGGLEQICDEAFMYAGAILNEETNKWEVNTELSKVQDYDNLASLYMEFPLAKLTYIGPSAFNTPAIRTFAKVAGEESRASLYSIWIPGGDTMVEGGFYYLNGSSDPAAIVKFTGKEAATINGAPGEKIKMDYVASVGGSYEEESVYFGSLGNWEASAVVTITVKTGSVYLYYKGRCGLCFASVEKVEKNAVVYLDDWYTTVNPDDTINMYVMNPAPGGGKPRVDCWLTQQEFKDQADAKYVEGNIFEDGWYMGQDNTLNTFVDKVDISSGGVPGM